MLNNCPFLDEVMAKVKGQCHQRSKVKTLIIIENSILAQFFGRKFLPVLRFGGYCHSSKVKGQGHLKVKYCALVS